MHKAAKSPDAAKPASKGPGGGGARVAVVGGGLAGLTAALRLAERGFQVTIYEASAVSFTITMNDAGGTWWNWLFLALKAQQAAPAGVRKRVVVTR